MLGIVLQNLSCGNGFKNLIKCDVLLNHFLLSMLGNSNIFHIGLSTYLLQNGLQVGNINLYAITSHSHLLVGLCLALHNGQGICGTFLHTLATDDALERLSPVSVVEHCLVRAKADARQAAYAQFLPQAHDALLVPVEGLGGTDLDALAALVTKDGAEGAFALVVDADTRLFRVGDLEPGLGADLLADVAADAELWIVG